MKDELPMIRAAMERYLDDSRVEALAFDYLHFYGTPTAYAWSPRSAIARRRAFCATRSRRGAGGVVLVVLETHKRGRYPRAGATGAMIYHYGWVKNVSQRRPSGTRT